MRQNVESYDYQVLNDARYILKGIGMPQTLYNPRSVMMFCACAAMVHEGEWRHISEAYYSTHEIITFINNNFPNKAGLDTSGYSENSRETMRDDTIKPWIAAGIMEAKPGLAPNDKNNSYRFSSVFAGLVRKYGTDEWEESLEHYNELHPSYENLLRQTRDIEYGYSVNYGDLQFELGRSKHNRLQIAVLEKFARLFASGSELLYIGDTSDRTIVKNEERLEELGINILSDSSKMPDIILYDTDQDRILFVEAYSSTGEFNRDRVVELRDMCTCPDEREIAFVTAFETTKKMLQVYKRIAWDTDIWVSEDETHITHKNGDRFMGRKNGEWWDQ